MTTINQTTSSGTDLDKLRTEFDEWYRSRVMPELLARMDPQQAAFDAFQAGRAALTQHPSAAPSRLSEEHPNLKVPIDPECSAKLDYLGDDRGQGLDPYWKFGFRTGWHYAKAGAAPSPKISRITIRGVTYAQEEGKNEIHVFTPHPYGITIPPTPDGFIRTEDLPKHGAVYIAPSAQIADAPRAMSNAEAAQWARENGYNVPPQWEAGKAQIADDHAGDELAKVLQEFVDYHSKPAGLTLETALDRESFGMFIEGVEAREKEMVSRAKALLSHRATQPPTAPVLDEDPRITAFYKLRDIAERDEDVESANIIASAISQLHWSRADTAQQAATCQPKMAGSKKWFSCPSCGTTHFDGWQPKCMRCSKPMPQYAAPTCQGGAQKVDCANELAEMEARKDAAYYERNQVVAALAKCFPSGVAKTAIEGWSEDWHGCVYIDLPTGQVSWHFHDSQAHLFASLPPYAGKWDGHDTPEKYRRVAALPVAAPVPVAVEDARDAARLDLLYKMAMVEPFISPIATKEKWLDSVDREIEKRAAMSSVTAIGGKGGE